MNNKLPDRVRSAMAQQPAGEPHPPADLLNAFAENALLPPERKGVLEHLAQCAECREIILLASEAVSETVEAPAAAAVPARRWRWMTWAAPATAAVVVVAAVLYDYRRVEEPKHDSTMARVESAPAGPAAPPAVEAPAAAPGEPPSTVARTRVADGSEGKAKVAARKDEELATLSAPVSPPSPVKEESDIQITGLRQLNTLERKGSMSNTYQLPSVVPPRSAPLSKSAGAVSGPMPAPDRQYESGADRSLREQAELRSPTPLRAALTPKRPAVGELRVQPYSFAYTTAPPAPAGAHWRVTLDGSIEWSAEPNLWTRVLEGQPYKYKVLAVVGDDLWAGGENGQLAHSMDRGVTWRVFAPVAKRDAAAALKQSSNNLEDRGAEQDRTGTIVSIRFSDPMNGEMRTDTGEVWVTADRGQTWRRK